MVNEKEIKDMQGTVKMCLELGYTKEQAELIGKLDDLFEEAIKLGLCSDKEATQIGISTGTTFGKHTGHIK